MVCTTYNEHSCWYKRVLPSGAHEEFARVDRWRMAALVPHLAFDDDDNITYAPSWPALLEAQADPAPAPAPVPVTLRRRSALEALTAELAAQHDTDARPGAPTPKLR